MREVVIWKGITGRDVCMICGKAGRCTILKVIDSARNCVHEVTICFRCMDYMTHEVMKLG